MDGEVLRDDQWERLKPLVPGGRKASADRAAMGAGGAKGGPHLRSAVRKASPKATGANIL